MPATYDILQRDGSTILDVADGLRVAISSFIPRSTRMETADLVFLCMHANGIPKEGWLSTLDALLKERPELAKRVLAIHLFDVSTQGASVELNRGKISTLEKLEPQAWIRGSFEAGHVIEFAHNDAHRRLIAALPGGVSNGTLTDRCHAMKLVAFGHSMGAAQLLMHAIGTIRTGQPNPFAAMICVEPVVWRIPARNPDPHPEDVALYKTSPLVKLTMRRVDFWPSREAARSYLVSKPFFQTWTPENQDMFLEEGLIPETRNGIHGVALKTPRESEASAFFGGFRSSWLLGSLGELRGTPILFVSGEKSNFLQTPAITDMVTVSRCTPGSSHVDISDASHMVILDKPIETAREIARFLDGALPTIGTPRPRIGIAARL